MKSMDKGIKRISMAVVGVLLSGIAIGIFKAANLGIDPYNTMLFGISNQTQIPYGTLYVIVNVICLIFMLVFARRYIGIGTFVNLFLLRYIISFVKNYMENLFDTSQMPVKIILLVVGVIVLAFSTSLYMTASLGVSTYDFIALRITEKKTKYFRFARIGTDAICLLAGLLLHEKAGIGTFITALCMGPFIAFFDDHFSKPLLNGKK